MLASIEITMIQFRIPGGAPDTSNKRSLVDRVYNIPFLGDDFISMKFFGVMSGSASSLPESKKVGELKGRERAAPL